MNNHLPPAIPVIFVCLILWRIYSRVRRNIGRQPLKRGRLMFRMGIYAVITAVLLAVVLAVPDNLKLLTGLLGGLVLGVPLGLYGVKLTKFEVTPEGRFYTPNPFLGVGMSMLMVGRIAYRFLILADAAKAQTQPQPMHSALTFLTFGLLAGYYITYFAGVLRRGRE